RQRASRPAAYADSLSRLSSVTLADLGVAPAGLGRNAEKKGACCFTDIQRGRYFERTQARHLGRAPMLRNRDKIREDKSFDLLTEAILQRDQPGTADLFFRMVRDGQSIGDALSVVT